jgi:Protein of unknown function (DUF2587)
MGPEPSHSAADPQVAHGELINHPGLPGDGSPPGDAGSGEADDRREAVEEPAKVMRIGSMIKQLLEEVRGAELDEAARARLREIFETSLVELGSALSPDLRQELERLSRPFSDDADGTPPSESELRIVQAQLVGWLEGLFHGIQATLFAQQMAARAQLEEMRRQIGPGAPMGPGPGPPPDGPPDRPGTYL